MNEHTRANRSTKSQTPAEHVVLLEETPARFDVPATKVNDGWASRLSVDYAIAVSGSETRETWAGF